MKKFKSKKIIILAVILIAIAGIYMFARGKTRGAGTAAVKPVKVENRIVEKTVSASGKIVSHSTSAPSFGASGKIINMNYAEGDKISKGAYIGEIDVQPLRDNAQAAKDTRDIALRNKELFIKQYASSKDLVGGSAQYEIRIRTLDEEISRAQANYDAAKSNISNAYLYAPTSGTITKVNAKEGEMALAGSPVVEISDLNNTYFEITLDQEDIGDIIEGQDVEVELDSYPNETFKGTVAEVPGYANENGSFSVKINLGNENERKLRLGMEGDSYIVVETTEKPVTSLLFDEIQYDEQDNPFVWVVENNIIKRVGVQTGLEGDVYTEVLTDLEGKNVVIALSDSTEVNEGFNAAIVE